jgi:hypothetical protein
MKWHMLVLAYILGYNDRMPGQNKKLLQAIIVTEAYHAGYASPPSCYSYNAGSTSIINCIHHLVLLLVLRRFLKKKEINVIENGMEK